MRTAPCSLLWVGSYCVRVSRGCLSYASALVDRTPLVSNSNCETTTSSQRPSSTPTRAAGHSSGRHSPLGAIFPGD